MLKEAILNSQLPSDEDILVKLMQARNSGQQPATIIGNMIEEAAQKRSVGADILKKYPRTLEYLCAGENIDWIIKDMERTLNYLKTMSLWLNKTQ